MNENITDPREESDFSERRYEVNEIFSMSFSLIKENALPLLLIFLMVYIPVSLYVSLTPLDKDTTDTLIVFMSRVNEEATRGGDIEAVFDNEVLSRDALSKALQIAGKHYAILAGVFTIALAFILASFSYILEESLLAEKKPTTTEALKHGVSRYPSVLSSFIFSRFVAIMLAFPFIIPGIVWYLLFFFLPYSSSLRKLSAVDTIIYSRDLVKKQWIWVLGMLIVYTILAISIKFVVSYLVSLIPEIAFARAEKIIPFFLNIFFFGITAFFSAIIYPLVFLNLDYVADSEYLYGLEEKEENKYDDTEK